ncbi:antibiotic biosynthesis monooxygenase [Polyangium jinanense]|uniref:antibiotic biosynthesis monooxygenase family protein n=1 Tax=Polyangium jinanense TaxID=2829994 RepID=UPI00234146D5|nr:antibiotic biosynthesis monooxygenase [Polyangium jinanense]MDC3962396.1 antibiotic biosynthesis monooxygenase [Polyangium jinanense]
MIYWIDVVAAAAAPSYAARWQERALALRAPRNLRTAELFEVIEPIRDVDYALLSVYGFDSDDVDDAALREGSSSDDAAFAVEGTKCRVRITLSELTPALPGHVWLINPFEINEDQIPDVLNMWDKAKNHMTAHAGFLNARLFRSAAPSTKYGLFNVSQWRSAGDFKQSLGDKAYDRHRERSMQYRLHPSLCARTHSLEFQ